MGSCFSAKQEEPPEEEKQSAAIDRQLEEDARRLKKECKILLLGSGESGKTTIVKQMKIIHQSGYSEEERLIFRSTIYSNALDGAKSICEGLQKLEIVPADEETQVSDIYRRQKHRPSRRSTRGLSDHLVTIVRVNLADCSNRQSW